MKFKIVVPFYNSQWIEQCISSIIKQTELNYDCLIIDDCSTLDKTEQIYNLIYNDDRFKFVQNTERKYALENIYKGLKDLNGQDEDVGMIIDGDDWLSCETSLQTVRSAYYNNNCMLTHGSWLTFPDNYKDSVTNSRYSDKIIKNTDFRYDFWRCSQLRTFKYKLFNNINDADLKLNDNWFKTTYDLALMFPMMEMAPKYIHFIDENIYTYNTSNEINDFKVNRKQQLDIERYIRSKKKYKVIYE